MRPRSRIAALLAAPLLLVAGSSLAGPATSAPKAEEGKPPAPTSPDGAAPGAPDGDGPGGDELPDDRPGMGDVPSLKNNLESGLAELGQLAEGAKQDGDAVRAACAQDKLDRGRSVMEVATGELLVIQDSGSSQQQKAFAVEKLQAAADRMARLVEQADGCSGDTSPEDEDDLTRNEVDEPTTIPVEDPTLVGGDPTVLPPADAETPVAIGSPSR